MSKDKGKWRPAFQPKRLTPSEALDDAFWLNWIGDHDYARRRLIHITDFYLREGLDGTDKKIPRY